MRIRNLILGTLAFFLTVALIAAPTRAHPPSGMNLSYDYDNQVLTVTVFHSVADVNTHYIEQLVINKNGQFEMDRNYTNQASITSMSDTFNIDAANNDILQVTAICSISGQIIQQITVSSDGLQTQPPPQIPGFPLAAIALGFLLTTSIILLRRRKKPIP
ncbi:MAG: hypothetical protein ACFFD8_04310 [Candidatus Thorarchaeota archaeon]